MKDPKREEQNAQEVPEVTPDATQAVLDSIPPEIAQQLKQAASTLSGIPAEGLTLARSMEILEGPNPDPFLDAEINRRAEDAMDQLFDNITDEQLEKLNEAARNGGLQQALTVLKDAIIQQTQEAQDISKTQQATQETTPEEAATPVLEEQLKKVQKVLEAGEPPVKEAGKGLSDSINDFLKGIEKSISAEAIHVQFANNYAALDAMTERIKNTMESISAIVNSPGYKTFKEKITSIVNFTVEYRDRIEIASELINEAAELAPFIELEIWELQKDPRFKDITVKDVLDRAKEGESLFLQILERARQHKKEIDAATVTITGIEQASEEYAKIKYNQTPEIKSLTDKLTNVFYDIAAPAPPGALNGQRQMIHLRYEGTKSKKQITLLYDYVFDEDALAKYGLSKKFDAFDFFVMTILDNQFEAGNTIVSLSKICNELGYSTPSQEQMEQVLNSMRRGMSTIITINDEAVRRAWDKEKNGKYHEITSPVLPIQIGTERLIVNGRVTNGFIKINARSPFLQVAAPLGHVTTWDKEILRLYKGRRTKRYYSVLRYLMMQIGWMRHRNSKRNNKILYSSLYEYTGDKSTRGKQLTRDMMYRLLDEIFIPAGYITSYKEEGKTSPGVVLTVNKLRMQLPES